MGLGPFRGCFTNKDFEAPNPNPSNWELLNIWEFRTAYVMHVKYRNCINFEGNKVMVYQGKYRVKHYLDPHFSDDAIAPIARFKPTTEGILLAKALAIGLENVH